MSSDSMAESQQVVYSGTRRRGAGVGRAGGAAWLLNTHSDHKIM